MSNEIIITLRRTWYLKTAIIENECIIKLVKDILDGRTYLAPLMQGISSNFLIYFLTLDEKLHQRLPFVDNNKTSFFVKQQ